MANGSDDNLGRIANSLESIVLAFLGPREAFIEIDRHQLKNVIGKVLQIWGTVKSELVTFNPPLGTTSTLAAPVRGVSPTLAPPVRGGQAAFFPGSGIPGDIVFQVGGVITFFDPRAEARSRLRKLLPPVQAEIDFLNKFQPAEVDEFGPDEAQDVYREVARRTTEVAGQTREGLTGVKDFLTQFSVNFDVEFVHAKNALEGLSEDTVKIALKPEEVPDESRSADSGGKAPPKPTSGGGKKKD